MYGVPELRIMRIESRNNDVYSIYFILMNHVQLYLKKRKLLYLRLRKPSKLKLKALNRIFLYILNHYKKNRKNRMKWIQCALPSLYLVHEVVLAIVALSFFFLFAVVSFQFLQKLLLRFHNTRPIATTVRERKTWLEITFERDQSTQIKLLYIPIRTKPFAFGFCSQANTREMEPFNRTQVVVA